MKLMSYLIFILLTMSLFLTPFVITGNPIFDITHISSEKDTNQIKESIISSTITQNPVHQSSRHFITHENQKIFKSSATINTNKKINDIQFTDLISLDEVGAEYYWGGINPVFTGTVLDSRNEAFPGVELFLFLNKSSFVDDPTQYQDKFDADEAGDYEYNDFNPGLGDLGFWNWTIWYDNQDEGDDLFGIDCYECAKVVAQGNFSVYDKIVWSAALDSDEVIAPADTIEFTASFETQAGNPLPVGIRNNYAIAYEISYNFVAATFGSQYFGLEDSITFTDDYSGTTEDAGTITLSINGTTPYYKIEGDTTLTLSFTINTDWIFNLYPTQIDGVNKTPSDLESEFFSRTDQLIVLSGKFNSSSDGVDANLWNNIPITIEFLGAGIADSNNSLDVIVNTKTNGSFHYNFSLSLANFSDPTDDLRITITHTDPGELLSIEQEVKIITIKLKGEADTLTNVNYFGSLNDTKHDPNLYYTNDGNDFTINGTVLDEAGRGANDVRIVLHITNQTIVNQTNSQTLYDSTNDRVALDISVSETITDENGNFEVTFALPEIINEGKFFTVNITISNNLISNNYRWENIKNAQKSIFTFEYLRFDDIDINSVDFKFHNNTDHAITLEEDIPMLNTTFFTTYQNSDLNYKFTIEIKDKHGRVPYNLTLNLNIDNAFHTNGINELNSRNNTQITINTQNNGIFTFFIHNITAFDPTIFANTHLAEFQYYFNIGNSDFDIFTQTYGQNIIIYGPDNTSMDVADLTLDDLTITNIESESENNITIRLDISNLESVIGDDYSNIRNVTIYWRASTTGGFNSTSISDFDFNSVPWNIANMTWDPISETFIFILNFNEFGHGYFFEVYFIIYDLAGHGVDFSGDTNGGNQWVDGLPNYDPSQANAGYDVSYSNFANFTQLGGVPFTFGMGDTQIHQLDVNNNVLIDNQGIANGYNITDVNQNVTITLQLPEDGTGYDSVVIYYRFLTDLNATGNITLNLDSVVFDFDTEYIKFNMTFIEVIGDLLIFNYIINSSEIFFNTYLDFYFNYTDGAGNNFISSAFVSESGLVNDELNIGSVRDTAAPVQVEPDNSAEVRKPGRDAESNEIIIYANETVSDFNITYTVQDINGTGLSDVTINWYYNGSLVSNLTQNYMIGGNNIWTNSSVLTEDFYQFNITIPSGFQLDDSSLTYEIDITDTSGNTLKLNPLGDANSNEFSFEPTPKPPGETEEPEEPPEPEDITEPATVIETIITTDEDGNEVTITNTTIIMPANSEETNNALWIIAGFLGLLGLLTLYYQRNNIKDMIQQQRRRKKVEGTLSDIIKEIRELGEQEKFKRAVLLIWDALERLAKEIVNSSRPFNVTAREFTSYLSTVTVVDRETLLTLSDTFESARYGKDDLTKEIFENAINALEETIESIIKSGARSRITNDDDDW